MSGAGLGVKGIGSVSSESVATDVTRPDETDSDETGPDCDCPATRSAGAVAGNSKGWGRLSSGIPKGRHSRNALFERYHSLPIDSLQAAAIPDSRRTPMPSYDAIPILFEVSWLCSFGSAWRAGRGQIGDWSYVWI